MPTERRVPLLAVMAGISRNRGEDVVAAMQRYRAAGGTADEIRALGVGRATRRSTTARWKAVALDLFTHLDSLMPLLTGSTFQRLYVQRCIALRLQGWSPFQGDIAAPVQSVVRFYEQASPAMRREMERYAKHGEYVDLTVLPLVAAVVDDPGFAALPESLVDICRRDMTTMEHFLNAYRYYSRAVPTGRNRGEGAIALPDLVSWIYAHRENYAALVHVATQAGVSVVRDSHWPTVEMALRASAQLAEFTDTELPESMRRPFLNLYHWAFAGAGDTDDALRQDMRRIAEVWTPAVQERLQQLTAPATYVLVVERIVPAIKAARAFATEDLAHPVVPVIPDARHNRWTQIAAEWEIDDRIAAARAAMADEPEHVAE